MASGALSSMDILQASRRHRNTFFRKLIKRPFEKLEVGGIDLRIRESRVDTKGGILAAAVFLIALQLGVAWYSSVDIARPCSAQLSEPPFNDTFAQLKSIEEQVVRIAGLIPTSLAYPENPTTDAVQRAATPFKELIDRIDRSNSTELHLVRNRIQAMKAYYDWLTNATETTITKLPSSTASRPRGELSHVASALWRVNQDLNTACAAANATGIRVAAKKGAYVCGLLKNGICKIRGELALLRHLSSLVLQMYDISTQDKFILERQPWRLVIAGWTSFKTEILQRKADLLELGTITSAKATAYDRIIADGDASLLEYAVLFPPEDIHKCADYADLLCNDLHVKTYHGILSRTDAGRVVEWRNIRLWYNSSATNLLWYISKAALCAKTYASSEKEFIIIAESLLSPAITFHNYLYGPNSREPQMSKYSRDIEEKLMTFEWDTGKGNDEEFFRSALDTFPCYDHVFCYISLTEVQKRKQGVCGDKVAMMVQQLQRAWDSNTDSIPLPCFPYETGALRNAKGEIESHAILFVKTRQGYTLVDYFGPTLKGRTMWRTYDAINKSRWIDPDPNSDYHYSDNAARYWFGWGKIFIPFPDGGYAIRVDLPKIFDTDDIGSVLNVPYYVASATPVTTATKTSDATSKTIITISPTQVTTSATAPAGEMQLVMAGMAFAIVAIGIAAFLRRRRRAARLV